MWESKVSLASLGFGIIALQLAKVDTQGMDAGGPAAVEHVSTSGKVVKYRMTVWSQFHSLVHWKQLLREIDAHTYLSQNLHINPKMDIHQRMDITRHTHAPECDSGITWIQVLTHGTVRMNLKGSVSHDFIYINYAKK